MPSRAVGASLVTVLALAGCARPTAPPPAAHSQPHLAAAARPRPEAASPRRTVSAGAVPQPPAAPIPVPRVFGEPRFLGGRLVATRAERRWTLFDEDSGLPLATLDDTGDLYASRDGCTVRTWSSAPGPQREVVVHPRGEPCRRTPDTTISPFRRMGGHVALVPLPAGAPAAVGIVLDPSAHTPPVPLPGLAATVRAAVMTEGVPAVLAASIDAHTVGLWELPAGRALTTLSTGPCESPNLNLNISPDGAWLLVDDDTRCITYVDLARREVARRFEARPYSTRFSPDGRATAVSVLRGEGPRRELVTTAYALPSFAPLRQVRYRTPTAAQLALAPREHLESDSGGVLYSQLTNDGHVVDVWTEGVARDPPRPGSREARFDDGEAGRETVVAYYDGVPTVLVHDTHHYGPSVAVSPDATRVVAWAPGATPRIYRVDGAAPPVDLAADAFAGLYRSRGDDARFVVATGQGLAMYEWRDGAPALLWQLAPGVEPGPARP